MTEKYLHCPICGDLDRHWSDTMSYCSKCLVPFQVFKGIPMSTSKHWIAQRLGREVSVVRMRYGLGRISPGWFGEDKVLIAENGFLAGVMDEIMKIAEREALLRNAGEAFKECNEKIKHLRDLERTMEEDAT